MLRWVILSVVVVVLAAAATLVVQYGTGSSPTWNLPAGVKTGGTSASGRGGGCAHS